MTDWLVAGVDEAGRGALAGPVVAAAVLFESPPDITGLTDSKLLSRKARQLLEIEIKNKCACWAVGVASAVEVDRLNVLEAALLAMKRAVESLTIQPQKVLVDGNHMPTIRFPGEAITKGDLREPVISAASIIAKETRDSMMREFAGTFPEYGFETHVGYGTKQHLQSLTKYGATPIHRKTFAPVRNLDSAK